MARLFESYVMVDWSAASKPATGADSIWIGALTPDSRLKLSFKATNPPTRAKAMEELSELLTRCLKRGDRVLVGVDFPLVVEARQPFDPGVESLLLAQLP